MLRSCRWYIIYRVLAEQPGRTVIYASRAAKEACLFAPDGVVRKVPVKVDADLVDLAFITGLGDCPLLLADSFVPPPLPFPTVTIASPAYLAGAGREDTRHLCRPHLHVPLPTPEEVRVLRELAFPSLDVEPMERRMQLWGPIPRLVLEEVSDAEQLAQWRAACAVPLSDLAVVSRGGIPSDPTSAYHTLVHERAFGDADPTADQTTPRCYQRDLPAFASPAIMRRVLQRAMHEHSPSAVTGLLEGTRCSAVADDAWKGTAAQWSALRLLQEGGALLVRHLVDAGPIFEAEEYNLPKQCMAGIAVHDASALATHTAHEGALFLASGVARVSAAGPTALFWDNDVSISAVVTAATESDGTIDAAALADVVTRLGWTPSGGWGDGSRHISYFWAVPEQQFDECWTLNVKPTPGSLGSELAAAVWSHVIQAAVRMPASGMVRCALLELERQCVPLVESLLPARR